MHACARAGNAYIGQLEALAPAAVLETLPADRLMDRKAFMWIDNLAAKYALQKGYSKVADSGRIVNAFKVKQAALRLRVWFEYVPTHQNVADLPSRGKWREMEEILSGVCDEWICFRWKIILPEFETWLAPLMAVRSKGRKRTRSGSRGAKRRRRS